MEHYFIYFVWEIKFFANLVRSLHHKNKQDLKLFILKKYKYNYKDQNRENWGREGEEICPTTDVIKVEDIDG